MKALGHMVSEKKIFHVFPMVGRICSRTYKEDHFTLLLTKYESFGPRGFGEEDFLKFFP